MGYTLREAAEATGKEPSTIQRAIKKGKLSAPLGESGSYDIDPAELHRVYPPVASNDTQPKRQHQGNRAQLESENRVLQAKVEMLSEVVGDLRGRLDKAEQERRETLTKLTALLTDQRPSL